tara:strand:+ start:3463 stop:3624 length:162 start_codon:yes stop_codon:yes gene_type:complete
LKDKKEIKLVTKTMWELQFGTKDNGEFYVNHKNYYIEKSVPTINGKKIYAKTD